MPEARRVSRRRWAQKHHQQYQRLHHTETGRRRVASSKRHDKEKPIAVDRSQLHNLPVAILQGASPRPICKTDTGRTCGLGAIPAPGLRESVRAATPDCAPRLQWGPVTAGLRPRSRSCAWRAVHGQLHEVSRLCLGCGYGYGGFNPQGMPLTGNAPWCKCKCPPGQSHLDPGFAKLVGAGAAMGVFFWRSRVTKKILAAVANRRLSFNLAYYGLLFVWGASKKWTCPLHATCPSLPRGAWC
jgi:hypothetical protein